MDKEKSEAQVAAALQKRANAVVSGKRLDQWDRDQLAMAKMIGQTRVEVNKIEVNVSEIALEVNNLVVQTEALQSAIEGAVRWNMIRDTLALMMLLLILLLVGYNTTQFWGW